MFFSVFVFLGVVYVWQHTQIVRIGLRIREKELRLKKLTKETKKIELKIAMLTSPYKIEKELKKRGLEMVVPNNKQIVYLDEPLKL